MTKKSIIVIFTIVILIFGSGFLVKIFTVKDIYKMQDKEIINVLKKNSNSNNFIKKYPDFKIEKKEILTKQGIIIAKDAQDFKEVYQNLELEDKRYLKIDLVNANNSSGLIAVLDFKKNQIIKVFDVLILESK